MSVNCSDIIDFMEELAPPSLAEEWDNVGLLTGSNNQEIKRLMVSLDATAEVIDEAADKKADMIISHHPLIFKPIKRINDDMAGKRLYKLIQNNISLYCAHTNLDMADGGINDRLAALLGLVNIKNLRKYKEEKLYKIVVFVPEENAETVRDSMCKAGAGWIGRYSDCSFMTGGTGTFRPLEGTNPYIGTNGKLEHVRETRLETIVPHNNLKHVLDVMLAVHPYEEAAYDIYPLILSGKEYGMGKVGQLEAPLKPDEFIEMVKHRLDVNNVRIIGDMKKEVSKVAVFSGSFDDNWIGVLKENADVLVTGDIKYHTAVDILQMGLFVIDAGHFNTEKIMKQLLKELLSEKFPMIDVITSTMEKDPFVYY